jgi:hypothetical protein
VPRRYFTILLLLYYAVAFSDLAQAETLVVGGGFGQTSIVSTQYKAKTISNPEVYAQITYPLFGRWSIAGQYQMNSDQSFTGLHVGIVFDSALLSSRGSGLNAEGQPEVVHAPKWLVRSKAGLGLYKFVGKLTSTDKSLGNKNEIDVQAELYGFSLGTGLYRFFNERWAGFVAIEAVLASAGNFGINSTTFALGTLWKFN